MMGDVLATAVSLLNPRILVLGGDLVPPLEKAGPEGTPVSPTRDDEDIEGRRCGPRASGVLVVLGLRAGQQPHKDRAEGGDDLFVARGAQGQQLRLGRRRPRQRGATPAHYEPREDGDRHASAPLTGGRTGEGSE